MITARDAGLAVQPRTLLALLAYYYVRQIYCSADIEACLRRDSNFCQLCHGTFPDAHTFRRFRRENRNALLLCLTAALRFVAEQKVARGVVTRFNEANLAEEANRTTYGLAASVWTRNLGTAHKMARRLRAGSIGVNMHGTLDPAMPFGGYKQSGWGREKGREVLDLYTEVKAVVMAL